MPIVLREMLLNRLEEIKRIGRLERRTDAIRNDMPRKPYAKL